MAKPERRDPEKERRWRRLLGLWQRSGLTGLGFCAQHGLSKESFYGWRREIARRDLQESRLKSAAKRVRRFLGQRAAATRKGKLPVFMQVKIEGATPATSAIEVVVGNGRILRVRPGFDAESLRQLLRLVEEPVC